MRTISSSRSFAEARSTALAISPATGNASTQLSLDVDGVSPQVGPSDGDIAISWNALSGTGTLLVTGTNAQFHMSAGTTLLDNAAVSIGNAGELNSTLALRTGVNPNVARSLAGAYGEASYRVISGARMGDLALKPATIPFAIPAFALTLGLVGFEILVAVLQAYIFTILAAVYIGGAIHQEH